LYFLALQPEIKTTFSEVAMSKKRLATRSHAEKAAPESAPSPKLHTLHIIGPMFDKRPAARMELHG
jgi:hypothetical protein